jgi:O-antigen ligase
VSYLKTPPKITETNKHKSLVFWGVMLFVMAFFLVAPFSMGLFNGGFWTFDGPIFKAIVSTAIALVLISFFLMRRWKLEDDGDALSLFIWLVPISFLISTVYAASSYSSIKSVYIHMMYAVFFIIGLYFTRFRIGINVILNTIMSSGYILVFFGFLNWFGNLHYKDAVLENRLSSIFQYPNTYAAYLIGLYFGSLILSDFTRNKYLSALHSFMLVPIFLSFSLTLSRGAMLVFPLVLILYLLFLPFVRQLLNLIYIAISGIATLLIFQIITRYGFQQNQFAEATAIKGWGTVLSVSLVVATVIFVIQRSVGKRNFVKEQQQENKAFRLTNLTLPAILACTFVVGAVALFGGPSIINFLPETLQHRIESTNIGDSGFIARTSFFTDSVSVIKDFPVFGIGGGGWSSLYTEYQSYVYTSRQAHNFYLQYLIEVGWFGFIVLIGLLAYIAYRFASYFVKSTQRDFQYERLVFVVISAALLFHSIIDFDMSFIFVGVLVFLCLGGMISFSRNHSRYDDLTRLKRVINITYPSALLVVSMIMLIYSIQMVNGNKIYAEALQIAQQSRDYNLITKEMDRAVRIKPTHPDYVITKIDLVRQIYNQTKESKYYDEATRWINEFKKKEPYNLQLLEQEFLLLMSKEDYQSASNVVSNQMKIAPWNIDYYERKISLEFEQGVLRGKLGDADLQQQHWNNASEIYEKWLVRTKQISELNDYQKHESMSFLLKPNIALTMGKVQFLSKKYKQAEETLREYVWLDTMTLNKEVARWYLATLQIQGLNDQELLDSLSKEDNTESQKVQQIIDMNK